MLTVVALPPVADGGPLDGAIRFAAQAGGEELASVTRICGSGDQRFDQRGRPSA